MEKEKKDNEVNFNLLFGILMTGVIILILTILGVSFSWWMVFWVFVLSYPYQIGDDIYSMWGGYSTKGSVFSLFGIYQNAYKHAFQIFGIAYMRASEDAVQLFGIAWMMVNKKATQFAGIACMNAGEEAVQGFGILLYQKADTVFSGVGLTLCRKARVIKSWPTSIVCWRCLMVNNKG